MDFCGGSMKLNQPMPEFLTPEAMECQACNDTDSRLNIVTRPSGELGLMCDICLAVYEELNSGEAPCP